MKNTIIALTLLASVLVPQVSLAKDWNVPTHLQHGHKDNVETQRQLDRERREQENEEAEARRRAESARREYEERARKRGYEFSTWYNYGTLEWDNGLTVQALLNRYTPNSDTALKLNVQFPECKENYLLEGNIYIKFHSATGGYFEHVFKSKTDWSGKNKKKTSDVGVINPHNGDMTISHDVKCVKQRVEVNNSMFGR